MADSSLDLGLATSILHSAVRGMHVYRIFSSHNIFMALRVDLASKYRHSFGVYDTGDNLVGHTSTS